MKDLALDPVSWDIKVENRDQVILTGVDALVQRLRIKLAHISGEWYLDTTGGSVNLGMITRKKPNIPLIAGIFRGTIERDPEIVRIKSFSVNFDQRRRVLSVQFVADSVYGEIRRLEEIA